MNPDPLSRDNVQQEQSQDTFCRKQKPGNHHSRSKFFLDKDDVMYRRQQNEKHQLVVPQTLVQEVIRESHDPNYVAHPGIKQTYSLISLNYWWPKMRESIEQYIRRCDPCQRRNENWEMTAPLGDVQEPKIPFEVTSMDINGPYPTTPRGNKYLLTFIDHLTKYVEAFPIPDHTAETCARVYSSQIVTCHGSGSTLITDQGREFLSSFFQRTCKILGVRRVRTSSCHAASNGTVERLHLSLHSGLSHYVNANHKNWDKLVPFYLMSHSHPSHHSLQPLFLIAWEKNDSAQCRQSKGSPP
jgi:hypothetical protein